MTDKAPGRAPKTACGKEQGRKTSGSIRLPELATPRQNNRQLCLAKRCFALQSPAMPNRTEAEEHLRVIRSLMEKATIYRAISAPTALVGGILSVVVAAIGAYEHWDFSIDTSNHKLRFFWPWISVLIITALSNAWFLHQGAKLRGEPFRSPGMRLAAQCMAPSFLTAGAISFFTIGIGETSLVLVWLLFYGLGLLSTCSFAPKSIAVLGWTFLGVAIAALSVPNPFSSRAFSLDIRNAHLAMGCTFGLFHLIYAACTWPRKHSASSSDLEP